MKKFTIRRTDAAASDLSTLMPRIVEETGSELQAASIMRSLERLGTDPTILFWEMTLETRGPRLGGTPNSAWRVRADRGVKVVADPA